MKSRALLSDGRIATVDTELL